MAGLLMLSLSLNNFGGQAWTNWMADLVPPRVRGLYFSRRSRMGIAVICLSGLAVALLLDLSEQAWFDASMRRLGDWVKMPPLIFLISIIFVVAGFVGMFDILSFLKVEEPPMKAVPSEPLFQRLARPLHDSHFCRFVVYWSVWNAAQGVCGWMWWPYLLGFFEAQKKAGNHAWWTDHMYLAATVILGVGFQLGQFIGYPMWGRAVDRFGRKPVLFVSSTLHSVGWVWWIFLSPALAPWLFVTQMVSGFLYGGQDIGSFNMMLQFNRRGGPGYQALGSVIFSIVGAGAAAASGVLADHYLKHFAWTIGAGTPYEHTFNKYAVIVAAAIAIKYIADLVFLPWVQDVGDKPASHALRFVFDNTYGYLNTLIFAPLRTGAEMTGRTFNDVRETLNDAADAASDGIRRWWR
jgi:hypothetical protein